VANSAYQIIADAFAFVHLHDFHREGVVMRTERQLPARQLDVFHGTESVLVHRVNICAVLAVGLQRIIVAVNQDRRPRREPRNMLKLSPSSTWMATKRSQAFAPAF
jgi:hypothetical protein